MIGRISVKRALKRSAGWAAATGLVLAGKSADPGVCIFVYHRIADIPFVDPHHDDWNVAPYLFERQLAAMAEVADFVSLVDVPGLLRRPPRGGRPKVCLTFDDGYANFSTQALPVLRRFGAPATLFVVTGVVGHEEPMPFDRWSQVNGRKTPDSAWRPIDWKALEACVATGLVTVGGHSHRHQSGLECTESQLVEEAQQSRSMLLSRLGESAAIAYSYPYGSRRLGQVPDAYVAAVRGAGYSVAVTTDLGLATTSSDFLALPRVEAHALDGRSVIHAKLRGLLSPYRLTDLMRRARRVQS